MTAQKRKLSVVCATFDVSPSSLAKLRYTFDTVHVYPGGDVPRDIVPKVEVWFTNHQGLPQWLTAEMMPKSQVLQLASAGANIALKHPAVKGLRGQLSVCTSSGIHVMSMPPYVLAQITNMYVNIPTSVVITRTEKRWPRREELRQRDGYTPRGNEVGFKTIRGKTVGLLGYGHIGREIGRLLKANGCTVLAANTSGKKSKSGGYIIPGTGDPEGSIPESWYSTTDAASLRKFLSRSEILVASLPSTPATRYMLKDEHFAALPTDALFINVGRGDLVSSDVILAALDKPDGLLGAGLDVADPEPLPDGHPLLSHPRVVITPHISADFEGYMDAAGDLLVANIENVRDGGDLWNVVDHDKGY